MLKAAGALVRGAGLTLLLRRVRSPMTRAATRRSLRNQNSGAGSGFPAEEERRLRLLTNSAAKYAIFSLNPEGEIQTWNKGAEKVFGYSEAEIVDRHFEVLFTPEDRAEGLPQAQLSQARAGKCVSEERWHLGKEGKRFFLSGRLCPMVDESRQLVGFAHVGRDITDRIRSEELARFQLQAEKRYRTLIENSSDITSLIDARGIIFYKSPTIRRILGFSADEMIGHHVFEFAHPDEIEMLEKLFANLLREPDKTVTGEFRHLHKDGSYRWMEGVASNLLAEPAVQAIVFNFRDITERKRAQAELQDARDRLRAHAQELEERVAERTAQLQESVRSLEGILYHVTHDLRAPLRAVLGHVTMLVRHCGRPSDPVVRGHEAQISAAVTRMDDLIQGLLGYGRLGYLELPRQNVSLQTRLAAILGGLAEEIRAKGAEVTVAEAVPPVRAHPGTLDQVLTNLIENALKFIAPGVPPRVRIGAEHRGDKVRISVQDNGIGISPEYHEKIFHVFERLHEATAYPGTGIGLAIVRKAVERMGGSVGVKSAPGEGSCFWIELPAAQPEP